MSRAERRELRRQLLAKMKRVARECAAYTDQQLAELVLRPADREQMAKVLASCDGILAHYPNDQKAEPLRREAERLRAALAQVSA